MEKILSKGLVKKLVVIVCLFTLLQAYFVFFSYVVKAMDMTLSGEAEQENNTTEEPTVEGETTNEVDDSTEVENEESDSNSAATENDVSDSNGDASEEIGGENTSSEEMPEEQTGGEVPVEGEENSEQEVLEEDPIIEDNPEGQETEEPVEEYVEPSVGIEVTSENTSIYKGYLYANATSDLRYETAYTTIDKVTFGGAKNITSVIVQDEPDKIVLSSNTKLGLLNDMYYKQTRISVEEFNNIIGEEGSIILYDENNIPVGSFSRETEIKNGYYVYTYPMQMNTVKFEFTNLIGDGQLSIINDKSIKESTVYSRNQITMFTAINTIANVQMIVGENTQTLQAEGNITLEETESKMTLGIDNDSLTVEGENEVAINVTLKTDEERYDLFENPSVDLEFPAAIDKVDITGINLLYKNGLSIDNWNVYTNSLGKEVLKINLTGSQLEYMPGAVQEGTTLMVYANLDVDRLTANTTENLKMTYTNKDTIRKSYMLEGKDSEDITLAFVGKQEIIRANAGTDVTDGETEVTYDDDVQKIQVNAEKAEQQLVTLTGTIVNNFEATTENVYLIGRIPFKGNKDGNGNELGSTFNTTLATAITTTGLLADVYYSENPDAGKNDETWTQDTTDMSKYKSYKIVVKDGSMAKGESLSFEYNVLTDANLGYNAKSYSTYTVYYSLDGQEYFGNCSFGIVTEEKEITTDDLEEDQKESVATLTVGTQITQGGVELNNGDSVYERQILRYKIIVKNDSNIAATNVNLKASAENSNMYYLKTWILDEYQGMTNYETGQWEEDTEGAKLEEEFSIDSLAPGESKTFEFQAIVKEDATETFGKIKFTGDNVPETDIETFKIPVNEAKIETRIGYASTEKPNETDIYTGSTFKLYMYVKNIYGEDLENVKASFVLPEELEFKENYLIFGADDLEFEITKTLNETLVTFNISKLSANSEREIFITPVVKELPLEIEENNITVKGYVTIGEEKYLSNDYQKLTKQNKTELSYTWKSDLEKDTLENGDIVTYTLEVTNIGSVATGEISLEDEVPAGLEILDAQVEQNGEILTDTLYDDFSAVGYVILAPGEKATFTIKFEVNEDIYERNQLTIENKVKVYGGGIDSFETDVISYKISNLNVTVNVENNPQDTENNSSNNELFYDSNETDSSNNGNQSNNNQPTTNQNSANQNSTNQSNQQTTTQEVKKTYNISGNVWLDKNKDGINSSESGMEGIVVVLYKANQQGSADISNKVSVTATNSSGAYNFAGVEAGNYVVAFNYDSSMYNVTKYQAKTATSSQNSDAISKTVTSGTTQSILAMTDVITIENTSLTNIDMGLVSKNDFDLALDKYISKVTVTNKAGTKNYVYENEDEIKLEINSKNYKSTELEITYKIVIKNEGDVDGYVNKIVDYIPDGITIDINANNGWYHGDDGNLYYNGLVGKTIEPGESKEITLTVKRSLANGEAIKITNSAEIAEYTNNLGFQDLDSVASNKMQKEDDFGTALITVAVSTGVIAQNIFSIIIIIISIVAIIFIIQNRKTQKKIYK